MIGPSLFPIPAGNSSFNVTVATGVGTDIVAPASNVNGLLLTSAFCQMNAANQACVLFMWSGSADVGRLLFAQNSGAAISQMLPFPYLIRPGIGLRGLSGDGLGICGGSYRLL